MADVRPDPRRPIDPRDQLARPRRADRHGAGQPLRAGARARADHDRAGLAPADAQPAWRQDFPIDWPQDHYVERRDFMKFMVLTSAAFTVGQVWIGVAELVPAARAASRRCSGSRRVDDLPVGGAVVFTYPDEHEPCLLVRLTDERVRRLQPEVHAPVLRRDSAAGRRQLLLPVSRGTLRSADRARRSPARRGGRCRASCSTSADGDIYATGVEERTI